MKNSAVNLVRLCREVEKPLDHIAAKHDDAFINRVVGSLNFRYRGRFITKKHDSVAHNLRVVCCGQLGALPIRQMPQRDFGTFFLFGRRRPDHFGNATHSKHRLLRGFVRHKNQIISAFFGFG